MDLIFKKNSIRLLFKYHYSVNKQNTQKRLLYDLLIVPWFLNIELKSDGRGTSEPSGGNFNSFKNQNMKKRTIIPTGATPKTLRLVVEKIAVGENPKNKTGKSYALVPNEAQFSFELYRLVHSFPELPGSLLVFTQDSAGKKHPIAVITSDSDLRASLLNHRVSNPTWCLQKLSEYQSSIIVFQPAKVGWNAIFNF